MCPANALSSFKALGSQRATSRRLKLPGATPAGTRALRSRPIRRSSPFAGFGRRDAAFSSQRKNLGITGDKMLIETYQRESKCHEEESEKAQDGLLVF